MKKSEIKLAVLSLPLVLLLLQTLHLTLSETKNRKFK